MQGGLSQGGSSFHTSKKGDFILLEVYDYNLTKIVRF